MKQVGHSRNLRAAKSPTTATGLPDNPIRIRSVDNPHGEAAPNSKLLCCLEGLLRYGSDEESEEILNAKSIVGDEVE